MQTTIQAPNIEGFQVLRVNRRGGWFASRWPYLEADLYSKIDNGFHWGIVLEGDLDSSCQVISCRNKIVRAIQKRLQGFLEVIELSMDSFAETPKMDSVVGGSPVAPQWRLEAMQEIDVAHEDIPFKAVLRLTPP